MKKGSMTRPTTDIQIRDQTPEQTALAVEITNASMPQDAHITLEEARADDGLHRPEEPPLRLLAWVGDQAVATGYAGRNVFTSSGRFRINLRVRHEFRRKGIATALYERLVPYALAHGAQSLTAMVHEHNLLLVERWLEREDYREVERMRPSELRLEGFEFARFTGAEGRLAQDGIVLTTLAEEDGAANRRKLWELSNLTRHDIPHDAIEDQPFEIFTDLLDRPDALRDCLVIARQGDRYIGFSLLVHQTPDRALTGMTGVHRDFRNRGIALAMKVRSIRLARERGYTAMRTFNHVNNPAMLAVNTRLGYMPLPQSIMFRKDLST
jgi:GNAT superfamily N-acetyltransferase